MGRRLDWRLVKLHRTYTFEEVAARLAVHKNTVRNWVRNDGLPALVESRPYLLRGEDLRFFLKEKQAARKQPLGAGQMFCLSCKRPRQPDPELVDDISGAVGPGHLRGLCPVCLTLMHRRIARQKIPDFLGTAAARSKGRSRH